MGVIRWWVNTIIYNKYCFWTWVRFKWIWTLWRCSIIYKFVKFFTFYYTKCCTRFGPEKKKQRPLDEKNMYIYICRDYLMEFKCSFKSLLNWDILRLVSWMPFFKIPSHTHSRYLNRLHCMNYLLLINIEAKPEWSTHNAAFIRYQYKTKQISSNLDTLSS